ncbi:MAG: hydroxypyruvate reductase, partial [Nitrosopumilus sp. CG10_big_fil_rev_8_21_14_0_10_33_7]
LKSGATIQEFNCIRKHLSKIKGGRLVENTKCHGIGLVMSDVEGDELSS